MLVIDQYTNRRNPSVGLAFSTARSFAVALFLVVASQILRLVSISSYDMERAVVIDAAKYFTDPCFRHQRFSDLAEIALLIFVGATLLARPKSTVLFLRRFGLDVNFVVSRAVGRKIGNRFRLVTLDDERFPSIGTTALERWLIRIVPPVTALGVIAVAVPIGAYFSNHPGSNLAQGDLGMEIQSEVGFYVEMFWAAFILVWVHTLATRRRAKLQVTTPQALALLMSEVDRSRLWLYKHQAWRTSRYLVPFLIAAFSTAVYFDLFSRSMGKTRTAAATWQLVKAFDVWVIAAISYSSDLAVQ